MWFNKVCTFPIHYHPFLYGVCMSHLLFVYEGSPQQAEDVPRVYLIESTSCFDSMEDETSLKLNYPQPVGVVSCSSVRYTGGD